MGLAKCEDLDSKHPDAQAAVQVPSFVDHPAAPLAGVPHTSTSRESASGAAIPVAPADPSQSPQSAVLSTARPPMAAMNVSIEGARPYGGHHEVAARSWG